MTPRQYEESVGEFFLKLGYQVELTPASNDYGVDIFAWKGKEKHAIQVKMYGNNRKINRQCVMELCGAKQYFDCDHAIIVTNGEFLLDAVEVAKKLNIQIIRLEESAFIDLKVSRTKDLTFDELWTKYILPLKGKKLTKANGESNVITDCNWGGIERITSNGKPGKIKIEIFKFAVNQLLATGSITRDEINQNYIGRASSGIILILSQVPLFKVENNPGRLIYSNFQK